MILMIVMGCFSAFAEEKTEVKAFQDTAMDLIEEGKYEVAFRLLDDRIKQKEWELQFLYMLRADCYGQFQDYEKARKDYIKALPRSTKGTVEYRLGRTLERLKQPREAIAYLDKSIEITGGKDKQAALARYYKSKALCRMGKYEEAKLELKKIDPETTHGVIMDQVKVMFDFCDEQEKKLAEQVAKEQTPTKEEPESQSKVHD